MPLRALPPQGSASANFATWASRREAAGGEKYTQVAEELNSGGYGGREPGIEGRVGHRPEACATRLGRAAPLWRAA